jgi:sugar (pentulose or hexulose) kinase
LGVQAHEKAGQKVTRITVSGGIARSELMCEILASMLDKPISTLESFEGPALGAATAAFASLELHMRKQAGIKEPFTIADAMAKMIRFKRVVQPNKNWVEAYQKLLTQFKLKIGM